MGRGWRSVPKSVTTQASRSSSSAATPGGMPSLPLRDRPLGSRRHRTPNPISAGRPPRPGLRRRDDQPQHPRPHPPRFRTISAVKRCLPLLPHHRQQPDAIVLPAGGFERPRGDSIADGKRGGGIPCRRHSPRPARAGSAARPLPARERWLSHRERARPAASFQRGGQVLRAPVACGPRRATHTPRAKTDCNRQVLRVRFRSTSSGSASPASSLWLHAPSESATRLLTVACFELADARWSSGQWPGRPVRAQSGCRNPRLRSRVRLRGFGD